MQKCPCIPSPLPLPRFHLPVLASLPDSSLLTDEVATELDGDAPDPPFEFLCPISMEIMADPVVLPNGVT